MFLKIIDERIGECYINIQQIVRFSVKSNRIYILMTNSITHTYVGDTQAFLDAIEKLNSH